MGEVLVWFCSVLKAKRHKYKKLLQSQTKMHRAMWRFRVDVRSKFLPGRVLKDWNRLPRDVTESPALEEFQNRRDVVLQDTV